MEIWKDIKEYKDLYKISCFGNVKALVKKAGSSNRKEKILKKVKMKFETLCFIWSIIFLIIIPCLFLLLILIR